VVRRGVVEHAGFRPVVQRLLDVRVAQHLPGTGDGIEADGARTEPNLLRSAARALQLLPDNPERLR
jgi:hypothetical protein